MKNNKTNQNERYIHLPYSSFFGDILN